MPENTDRGLDDQAQSHGDLPGKSTAQRRLEEIARYYDQVHHQEVQLPDLSDVLYAVRVISEGRLGTESMEGLQEAVEVLLNEIEKRSLNGEASAKRQQELTQQFFRASIQLRDASSDEQKAKIQNDLLAYQFAIHPEDALTLINLEIQNFDSRGANLSDDDSNFGGLVIPEPERL